MNLQETLKQFKNIAPDAAYKEHSKRAILATLPRERWNPWRSVAAVFETGIAVALSVFFILIVTGQLSGNSIVSPVQFSAIDPKTLNAEAQAVDIQIKLANVAYQESTTTTSVSALTDVSPPQAAARVVGAIHPSFTAAILNATSTALMMPSSSSTATSTTIVHTELADACALTSADTAALQAVQNDSTLTPNQELTNELALRKQLLAHSITCYVKAAQALKATLTVTKPATPNAVAVQSELSARIDDGINFYNIESVKLNDAGISSSEAISKEMMAWRAANYIPLEGSVNNFALWSSNQLLFQTAQTRLSQTGRIVAFIENAAGGNTNLSVSFKAAQASLGDAQNDNTVAAADLTQLQPPAQSLADIQQSLQALADTYQKFSELNKLIQTLLPTQQ